MGRWLVKVPRPRFRTRTLLAMVAAVAVGLGAWLEYRRPERAWRRAIHSEVHDVVSSAWYPIFMKGRIDGLDLAATEAEVAFAAIDRDPFVRAAAVWHGREVDKGSLHLLPTFLRGLVDREPRARAAAAGSIGEVVRMAGKGVESARPSLLKALDDPDPWTRQRVVEALGEVARLDPANLDGILAAVSARLRDRDEGVWQEAARVLARFGRGDEAIPQLEAFMIFDRARDGGKDPGGTGTADNALARMADRSDEVTAFLLREVYRRGQGLPNRFFHALMWVDPPRARAVAMATEALTGPDRDLRVGSAYFLEGSGHAALTRSAWLEALRHPDPDVRRHAINSLRLLGPRDPAILAAIGAVGRDDLDPDVRKAAGDALPAQGVGEAPKDRDHPGPG